MKKNLSGIVLVCGGILLFYSLDHVFNNLLYAILLGASIIFCLCSILISICYCSNQKRLLRYILLAIGLVGISIMNIILIDKILTAIMLSITIIIFSLGLVIILNMKN